MTTPIKPDVAGALLSAAPATDAAAIIGAVERLSEADLVNAESAHAVLVPTGKRLESLKTLRDQFRTAPERITGTATLTDEASFIAHINAMKREETSVFADPTFTKPSLTAVYDYHAVHDSQAAPAFAQHRAHWPLTLSKEWVAWMEASTERMSSPEFAEFLEAHAPDVFWGDQISDYTKTLVSTLELKLASPSQLIALSRNLAINVNASVRQAQTLSSGEVSIQYTEVHADGEGQPIKVPNAFLIAIPVIQGGPTYQLLVRLYYRVGGGKVTWLLAPHRTDVAFDDAVREICTRVAEATGCPVYLGTPEK